ncbi:unnamed protein product [Amoebophrya sp. A25]|nr:unnamed protein product [Amoebophrya sp. A25]|eukprot:GSA25T00009363001.1
MWKTSLNDLEHFFLDGVLAGILSLVVNALTRIITAAIVSVAPSGLTEIVTVVLPEALWKVLHSQKKSIGERATAAFTESGILLSTAAELQDHIFGEHGVGNIDGWVGKESEMLEFFNEKIVERLRTLVVGVDQAEEKRDSMTSQAPSHEDEPAPEEEVDGDGSQNPVDVLSAGVGKMSELFRL